MTNENAPARFLAEFSDYDAADEFRAVLALPGARDESWHNDATPTAHVCGWAVWVDFADENLSEFCGMGGNRFGAVALDDDGCADPEAACHEFPTLAALLAFLMGPGYEGPGSDAARRDPSRVSGSEGPAETVSPSPLDSRIAAACAGPIRTQGEARAFLRRLIAAGLSYHPDDSAASVFDASPVACALLDERTDAARHVLELAGHDICAAIMAEEFATDAMAGRGANGWEFEPAQAADRFAALPAALRSGILAALARHIPAPVTLPALA